MAPSIWASQKERERRERESERFHGLMLLCSKGTLHEDMHSCLPMQEVKKRSKRSERKAGMMVAGPGTKQTGVLTVDRWLQFEMPCAVAGPMAALRTRLTAAFSAKVQHPHQPLPPALTGLPASTLCVRACVHACVFVCMCVCVCDPELLAPAAHWQGALLLIP